LVTGLEKTKPDLSVPQRGSAVACPRMTDLKKQIIFDRVTFTDEDEKWPAAACSWPDLKNKAPLGSVVALRWTEPLNTTRSWFQAECLRGSGKCWEIPRFLGRLAALQICFSFFVSLLLNYEAGQHA
jgi:hypothetical protein